MLSEKDIMAFDLDVFCRDIRLRDGRVVRCEFRPDEREAILSGDFCAACVGDIVQVTGYGPMRVEYVEITDAARKTLRIRLYDCPPQYQES